MIDRGSFFDRIRPTLFDGRLRQTQVDGLTAFLDTWEAEYTGQDDRRLAYVLGTAHHETGHTFEPVAEIGRGRGKPYGRADPDTGQCYFGRGFVQLTWKDNYRRMGDAIGVDLVHRPDLAMDTKHSLKIIFVGMTVGMFTGKRLPQYFSTTVEDWENARRIVNGTDRADEIARIARRYHAAVSHR